MSMIRKSTSNRKIGVYSLSFEKGITEIVRTQ
jgi:hypothetical protein